MDVFVSMLQTTVAETHAESKRIMLDLLLRENKGVFGGHGLYEYKQLFQSTSGASRSISLYAPLMSHSSCYHFH